MSTAFVDRTVEALKSAHGYSTEVALRIADNAQEMRNFEAEHVVYQGETYAFFEGDFKFEVETFPEYVSDPREWDESLSDEDVKAWNDNAWSYVTIKVSVSRASQHAIKGHAFIGMTAIGDWWSTFNAMDADQQILSTVFEYDLMDEAKADLASVTECPTCHHSLK